MFFQIGGILIRNQIADQRKNLHISQLGLCLSFKLGFFQLHTDNRCQTFPDIIAGKVFIVFLENIIFPGIVIHDPG